MPGLLPHIDPDGLLEYSVVYTDRALNHMSQRFQGVMQDMSATLKRVYGARSAIVVPGSGTFGMEAVARQFATGKKVLVIRNGWFSFRWSQIFEMGAIPAETQVLKARPTGDRCAGAVRAGADRRGGGGDPRQQARRGVRAACRDLGRHAAARRLPERRWPTRCTSTAACSCSTASPRARSGWTWRATGVDVLVSAPQKGWSSTPCAGLVMLGEARARTHRRHHQQQLLDGPEEVAADHGNAREGRPSPTTPRCPPTAWRSCAT